MAAMATAPPFLCLLWQLFAAGMVSAGQAVTAAAALASPAARPGGSAALETSRGHSPLPPAAGWMSVRSACCQRSCQSGSCIPAPRAWAWAVCPLHLLLRPQQQQPPPHPAARTAAAAPGRHCGCSPAGWPEWRAGMQVQRPATQQPACCSSPLQPACAQNGELARVGTPWVVIMHVHVDDVACSATQHLHQCCWLTVHACSAEREMHRACMSLQICCPRVLPLLVTCLSTA